MTKRDKLIQKFLSKPKDFTWDELVKVLSQFGFQLFSSDGSRRKFINNNNNIVISLHEPHPKKVIKSYVFDIVIKILKQEDLL